jgi:hypothetical protein
MRCDIAIVDGDQGLLIPYEHRGERPWHLACWFDELGITEMIRHQRTLDRKKLLCMDPDCLWDFEHTLAYCGRA